MALKTLLKQFRNFSCEVSVPSPFLFVFCSYTEINLEFLQKKFFFSPLNWSIQKVCGEHKIASWIYRRVICTSPCQTFSCNFILLQTVLPSILRFISEGFTRVVYIARMRKTLRRPHKFNLCTLCENKTESRIGLKVISSLFIVIILRPIVRLFFSVLNEIKFAGCNFSQAFDESKGAEDENATAINITPSLRKDNKPCVSNGMNLPTISMMLRRKHEGIKIKSLRKIPLYFFFW